MKRLGLALGFVLLVSGPALAGGILWPSVYLAQVNVDTFDPMTFTSGHHVDVYELVVENPFPGDITSLEISAFGSWVNNQVGGLTFRDSVDLPNLGPYTVAETFFVLPDGETPLAVDVVDSDTLLQASYTVAGSVPLVPSGGYAVLAVFSVPTGAPLNLFDINGRGVIDGEFYRFAYPEPSSALLLGLGCLGFAGSSWGRRRENR